MKFLKKLLRDKDWKEEFPLDLHNNLGPNLGPNFVVFHLISVNLNEFHYTAKIAKPLTIAKVSRFN